MNIQKSKVTTLSRKTQVIPSYGIFLMAQNIIENTLRNHKVSYTDTLSFYFYNLLRSELKFMRQKKVISIYRNTAIQVLTVQPTLTAKQQYKLSFMEISSFRKFYYVRSLTLILFFEKLSWICLTNVPFLDLLVLDHFPEYFMREYQ